MKPGIYAAIVKDNTDKMGQGRVRVYVPDFGGDPTDENTWYLASPASPHAGASNPYKNEKGGKTDAGSQDAYGMWATGYHLENEVLVLFANSKASAGIIIGAMFGQNMTNSVAGYPAAKSNQGTTRGVHPPTVEYNKRDEDVNPRTPTRPRRELLSQQLKKQGLYRDFQRGQTSTSPHRDLVPQFTSMKTPRGNTFVMDDGKLDEGGAGVDSRYYSHPASSSGHMNLKTSRGAQVLINDACGYVYMNTADGNAFHQIADNAISLFSNSNMTLRAKAGISVRVDGDYNTEIIGNMSVKAIGKFTTNVQGNYNLFDNGTGIAYQTAGAYSVKAQYIGVESSANHSKKSSGLLIEDATAIHENSFTPSAVPTAGEISTGTSQDREGSGCNSKKETDSSLPGGSLVTHEPSATHGGACGHEPSPPGINCDPTVQQTLSDGSQSESFADPDNECGNDAEGQQDNEQDRLHDEAGHDEHDHDHDDGDLPEFTRGSRNPELSRINPKLVSAVQQAAKDIGMEEIPFNSGYRDPTHNAKVGGVNGSQHIHGNAIDIGVGHMNQQQRISLIQALANNGVTGIGVYNNAIHADMRSSGKNAWGRNGSTYSGRYTPNWARGVLRQNGYSF